MCCQDWRYACLALQLPKRLPPTFPDVPPASSSLGPSPSSALAPAPSGASFASLGGSVWSAVSRAASRVGGSLRVQPRSALQHMDAAVPLSRQLLVVLLVALFVLYPALSAAVLSVFACYLVDDGRGPFAENQRVRATEIAIPVHCLPTTPCTPWPSFTLSNREVPRINGGR